MAKLGEIIREKRRGYNWTQAELAQKVGLTDGYIGKIEISYQRPGLKALTRIAKVLNIPLDNVLDAGIIEGLTEMVARQEKWDKEFHELRPEVKLFLLEIAPLVEKYVEKWE